MKVSQLGLHLKLVISKGHCKTVICEAYLYSSIRKYAGIRLRDTVVCQTPWLRRRRTGLVDGPVGFDVLSDIIGRCIVERECRGRCYRLVIAICCRVVGRSGWAIRLATLSTRSAGTYHLQHRESSTWVVAAHTRICPRSRARLCAGKHRKLTSSCDAPANGGNQLYVGWVAQIYVRSSCLFISAC